MATLLALAMPIVWSAPGVASANQEERQRPSGFVANALGAMNLDDKIGQLFVSHVYGNAANTVDPDDVRKNRALAGVDNAAQLISKYRPGGIILFKSDKRNLTKQTPVQTATFVNDLQRAATNTGAKVPLQISTDEEGGGFVSRVDPPFVSAPAAMALGASFSARIVRAAAAATGQQLKALGINVINAPVVDTNTNPANEADGARAFSDNPRVTEDLGPAAVEGYQSEGISAGAKHFPGLGSVTSNTDYGVGVSHQTREEFNSNDFPAFRSAIRADVDQIMVSHAIARSLDPSGKPASLSPAMVTGILRGELNYNGLVVSDAMEAVALDRYVDPQTGEPITDARRAIEAIKAGVDQILMSNNIDEAQKAVKNAVQNGEISLSRIDESVTRILRSKEKIGLFNGSQVDVSDLDTRVGTARQTKVMYDASLAGVTLYRNESKDGGSRALPLTSGSGKKVLVAGYTTVKLAEAIQRKGLASTSMEFSGNDPTPQEISDAVSAATDSEKAFDYVVFVSKDAWRYSGQRDMVARLVETGKPVIVLAVGAPYELAQMPAVSFLASFGYEPSSIQAATDVLFGAKPGGRSPITIRNPQNNSEVASYGCWLDYEVNNPAARC